MRTRVRGCVDKGIEIIHDVHQREVSSQCGVSANVGSICKLKQQTTAMQYTGYPDMTGFPYLLECNP